jgi:ABC-type lipoprotein release transport system permease subunit
MNLIDLATFRDLYGFMTPDSKKELDELKKRAGATTEVKREDAEADLFGEGSRVVTAEATPGLIDHFKDADASMLKTLRDQEKVAKVFTQQELEAGAVLNAAVFLKDPSDGALKQSIKDIEAQTAADQLPMHAVSWQKASGNIGQFALMLQVILIVMVMIIFSVALVIINNALVMATLERVKEIGTLRAIGAQKNFILLMLFIEAVVVGLVFGGLGALLGAGTVQLIAHWGIPATSDIMYFLFSGPRLIPFLHVGSLIGAFVVVLIVSGISSFYPALLAMRVSPLVAMQTDE